MRSVLIYLLTVGGAWIVLVALLRRAVWLEGRRQRLIAAATMACAWPFTMPIVILGRLLFPAPSPARVAVESSRLSSPLANV